MGIADNGYWAEELAWYALEEGETMAAMHMAIDEKQEIATEVIEKCAEIATLLRQLGDATLEAYALPQFEGSVHGSWLGAQAVDYVQRYIDGLYQCRSCEGPLVGWEDLDSGECSACREG